MKTKIQFTHIDENSEWPHFAWKVEINGVFFDYKTGLGHKTNFRGREYGKTNKKPENSVRLEDAQCWAHVPNIDDVLNCLFSDARAGAESFNEFCSNFGYSNDSLKALDTYRACMDSAKKLRLALGKDYETERARIEALEL